MRAPSRQQRRVLERKLRQLGDQSATWLASLRRTAGKETGRDLVEVRLHDLAEALNDEVIGPHVVDAMICVYGAVHGLGVGELAECYCCHQRWSDTRIPGAAVTLSASKPVGMLITFICDECLSDPAEAERRLGQVVSRDFFDGEATVVPVAAMPAAGRA
jgi:hypothetical protein